MIKVLHTPFNVGGFVSALVDAERNLGIDARFITLYETQYNYPGGESYNLNLEESNIFQKLIGHMKLFWDIRKEYDAYHFNFGFTPLHFASYGITHADLPFYDSNARKIFTYQGCDARQKYPTMERNKQQGNDFSACFEEQCYGGSCNSGKRDYQRQKAIEKVDKYADHIFALNPDLMFFLPENKTTFLPYLVEGRVLLDEQEKVFFNNNQVHIIHAPTQRATKGTEYIEAAFEALKDEFGERVKFTIVENLPHEEAMNIYKTADLAIDQLLIGWYGGLAVEMMNMGVPVAVYINPDHLQFIPEKMANSLPFLNINKLNIFKMLKQFILDREMTIKMSKDSLKFVETWHNPSKIAGITKAAYTGEVLLNI